MHYVRLRCQLNHFVQLTLFLPLQQLILNFQSKSGFLTLNLSPFALLIIIFSVNLVQLFCYFFFESRHTVKSTDTVAYLHLVVVVIANAITCLCSTLLHIFCEILLWLVGFCYSCVCIHLCDTEVITAVISIDGTWI